MYTQHKIMFDREIRDFFIAVFVLLTGYVKNGYIGWCNVATSRITKMQGICSIAYFKGYVAAGRTSTQVNRDIPRIIAHGCDVYIPWNIIKSRFMDNQIIILNGKCGK